MEKHQLYYDDKSIYVNYAFAINVQNTKKTLLEIVDILDQSKNRMNIVVDLHDSHLTDNNIIALTARLLKPHRKKINSLYMVGVGQIQKMFFHTVFTLIGGKSNKYFRVMSSLEEVNKDIEHSWENFKKSKKK